MEAGLVRCGLSQQGIKIEVNQLVVHTVDSGRNTSHVGPSGSRSISVLLWVGFCVLGRTSGLLGVVAQTLHHVIVALATDENCPLHRDFATRPHATRQTHSRVHVARVGQTVE